MKNRVWALRAGVRGPEAPMHLLRSIFSGFSRSGEIVITRLLWCLAFLHFRPHYIRAVRPGGVSLAAASRVAVLVHFDRRGRFLSYVRYFVSALNRAGFAVVIASNSRRIDQESLAEILPHCAAVVHRPNVGREFGAWRDALTVIGNITRLECLVIANDSVFGPFSELGPLLQRCDFAVADVWGMTDSYFRRYHLQSYFLIFGPTALASRFFHDFWRSVRYLRHKRSVIELYEMGLTRALLRGGLRVRALFPYTQLVDAVLQRALEARPDGPALAAQLFDTLLRDADLVAPRKGARALAAEFFDMLAGGKFRYTAQPHSPLLGISDHCARFSIPQARVGREEPSWCSACRQLAKCPAAIDRFSHRDDRRISADRSAQPGLLKISVLPTSPLSPPPQPSPASGGGYSQDFRRVRNGLRNHSDDCVKPSLLMGLLMGEGLEGWSTPRFESGSTKAAAANVIPTWRVLGCVTPTLTRPHQGGGNALTIREYRS